MPDKKETSTTDWRVRDALRPPFTLDLVWLVLPAAIALISFGLLPLRSWDYWWHITMGRLIDHWQAVPAANHYLYTMPADAPSYVQPWMSQWALFWLHDVGTVMLPLIVRNVFAALVFGGLGIWAMRRARSAMLGSLLACAGLAIAFPYLDARTHLFVWPIFVGLVGLGYGIRARKAPFWLIALFPAAAALWANLHGSFLNVAALCLAFGAAALADRKLAEDRFSAKRAAGWFAALSLSAAAPLLNPRGAEIYGYLADMLANEEIRATITEWMPTTFVNPTGIGALFYAVLIVGAYLFWRNRHRVDIADVLLFAGFGALAISAARGLLWFGMVAPIALAPYLVGARDEQREAPPKLLRLVNLLFALGLFVTGILLQPGMTVRQDVLTSFSPAPVRTKPPMAGFVPEDTPLEHTAILANYRAGLRVFHNYKHAGYLMYHMTDLSPEQVVFVDQRIELPPPRIWRLYETVNDTPAWRGIFQQYGIDAAVLDLDEQTELVERMRQSGDWAVSYEDEHNVLFLRNE